MNFSTTRLLYSYKDDWYDLGHIEAVDTDNVIFEIPRLFKTKPEDIKEAWGALEAGKFKGRFLASGVKDDGQGIAGEFWFDDAVWCKDDEALEIWLRCRKTRRKIINDFHVYLI